MYINITASEVGDNKGSCSRLVNYLEKENRENVALNERWFNGTSIAVYPQEVRMQIDSNIAKLTKQDSKFFLLNISPSQQEIQHLIDTYGKDNLKDNLKAYSIKVMDAYAQNFKRNGVNGQQDLLWFAKAEEFRYYGYQDEEVKNGHNKRGDKKEGAQWHVQVIVSRKDINNKIKLSPQNTSKGKNVSHSAKLGQFDRVAFKESGEHIFDEMFGFDRGLKEKMTYANIVKNGSVAQKVQLQTLERLEDKHPTIIRGEALDKLVSDIQKDNFCDTIAMLSAVSELGLGVFSLLLEDHYEDNMQETLVSHQERKRKKKQRKRGISR